jgi:predicted DNA-binding transcriptional regulator YafY
MIEPHEGGARMPRNAEVVRQWRILLELEASRWGTIDGLAEKCGVTTRTIRRDIDALQEAGFPLFDERVEGKVYWKLAGNRFKAFAETGLTLSELCAFYFSRTVLECLAGAPFSEDLRTGFEKLAGVLTPRMRAFLDRLPAVLAAKEEPKKRRDTTAQKKTVSTLVEATLSHRRLRVTYFSFASRRVKQYLIEPYRLAYGQGGLYLFAFVPAYVQMRTFAVERIRKLSPLEEHFSPVQELPEKPFAHSIGIHVGKPEPVEIQFAARVVPYISEREWHATQKIRTFSDGSLVLSLKVCADWALESWILSFGPFARVLKPVALAERVLEGIEEAREQYAPHLEFDVPQQLYDMSMQPALAFADSPR